jgi:hypothetical protein
MRTDAVTGKSRECPVKRRLTLNRMARIALGKNAKRGGTLPPGFAQINTPLIERNIPLIEQGVGLLVLHL